MHKGGAEMKKNNSKLKAAVAVVLAALLHVRIDDILITDDAVA